MKRRAAGRATRGGVREANTDLAFNMLERPFASVRRSRLAAVAWLATSGWQRASALDILAHVFHANDFPTGSAELDLEQLSRFA
jgi:hypothetical protein